MDIPNIPFQGFNKIARLARPIVITEKIDGTNASIYINDSGDQIHAASRTKWIVPGADNAGFAGWVEANKAELLKLGPGLHFGEWWGASIQRRYGLKEKRFSLFNVGRWGDPATRPAIVGVVPTLYTGPFDTNAIDAVLADLIANGSKAAPGYMDPEGIVIWHQASGQLFKRTCKNDEKRKSEVQDGG